MPSRQSEQISELERLIEGCLARDEPALRARIGRLRARAAQGRPVDRDVAQLESAIATSRRSVERRCAAPLNFAYPESLPIVTERERVLAVLERHPVVVLCGETGSGKTTQLPKFCLELRRGTRGLIGHTQPRRIAARSLAARIAEELGVELGGPVGCKVRFHERLGEQTRVKVMTDGILLAETQSDPELRAYDTLIIDEAHERSLNIDFLLGYLRRLLRRRRDLKVIITSATIDPQRFSRHFDAAPIVEVSGRSYPVEIRYRPLTDERDDNARDQGQAIVEAVDELAAAGPGDMLVFLPGERDIRDTAELLRKHHPAATEILPLYARLSADQQNRVFRAHGGRRIVLSTNVAETSLTVPGIRYVIDTGVARISRYSYRTKVQRLPIEPISQASASQRSGRCGRVAAGICIRLYGEADFLARPAFTDPEIQRTHLAAVILQMAALKLGDPLHFPFIDAPDPRSVRDGYKLLHELGAVDADDRLTELGGKLARFPVDPRLGRMLLAAGDLACLSEVLVIAAALSIPDPRERPLDRAGAADAQNASFEHPKSDFLGFVNLWNAFHEQARHLSANKLRQWCQTHFVSYLRMREWRDIHGQLLEAVRQASLPLNAAPAEYEAVHRALLSGLLGHVAFKSDDREYTGARNLKLELFPGSVLARRKPAWVVAAELMETGKRYLRTVAAVEPEWIEQAAGDLAKRTWFEPWWDTRSARVMASEKVTLYGLPLVVQRKVDYGPIDPPVARELFIRHALVNSEYRSDAGFIQHNRRLLEELGTLAAKTRRVEFDADEQALFAFFDERIPDWVCSGATFERWWREQRASQPGLLNLDRGRLLHEDADTVTAARYPDVLTVAGIRLPVSYHFTPGADVDGVTFDIPLPALNQMPPARFDWLVPGLLQDKVAALIKTLPKQWRRNFVPVPDFARAFVALEISPEQPLVDCLARELERMTGVRVPADAWHPQQVPVHLAPHFRILDEQGKVLGEGGDLHGLQSRLAGAARQRFAARTPQAFAERVVNDWDFGDLAPDIDVRAGREVIKGYPALSVSDDEVRLRVIDDPARAVREHRAGLLHLFARRAHAAVKDVRRRLPDLQKQCLWFAAVGSCESLTDDLMHAILSRAFLPDDQDSEIRTQRQFEARLEAGRPKLVSLAGEITASTTPALAEFHELRQALQQVRLAALVPVAQTIERQMLSLIHVGFVSATPIQWLPHLARFLKAARVRLERAGQDLARDRAQAAVIDDWSARLQAALEKHPDDARLTEFRWLIEELRVSLFAQALRTSVKVSPQRLEKLWAEMRF